MLNMCLGCKFNITFFRFRICMNTSYQNQQTLCGCLPLFPSLQPCSTSPRKPKMLHGLQALPRKLKKRWKIPPCLPAGHLFSEGEMKGVRKMEGRGGFSPYWTPIIRHNNETSTFLDDRCEPCLGSSFFLCIYVLFIHSSSICLRFFTFGYAKKSGTFLEKNPPCRIPRCIPAGLPPLRQHRHHSSASTLNFRSPPKKTGADLGPVWCCIWK